jgi:predicted glycogen debranching enzyme
METASHHTEPEVLKVLTPRYSADELAGKEWLLTNSRAGFASGTVIGCNTRRYHGLLIGSLTPPANRIAALSNCLETVTCNDNTIALSTFEFDRTFHPHGYEYLTQFRKNLGVHFDYELGIADLTKSIYLLPDSDVATVVYEFSNVCAEFEIAVRPFAAMRDFHSLQNSTTDLQSVHTDQGDVIIHQANQPRIGKLTLRSEGMDYADDPQWWHRFLYRIERFRGQDCFEDLWSPGRYAARISEPTRLILWAALTDSLNPVELEAMDIDVAIDALHLREKELLATCEPPHPIKRHLFLAAGQFVTERVIQNETTPTIMAGYPWFLDWGRDTFIALEGLCLCTGRTDTAWGVLKTFAGAVSEGMIPNRFDDYGGRPHYNSIDASLWFIHAAFAWLKKTGNVRSFAKTLLPAIKWIVESYRRGTRFNIHTDADKLVTGGDAQTQLTWMDAKFDGVCFTPRHGKAVEVNALWYNALCHLAKYYKNRQEDNARFYAELAKQVAESFVQVFWNEPQGYLNDCVLPDGTADASLRPNQILAVSLPYSPLDPDKQKKVVAAVQRELLTSRGLRTLAPSDPRYKGRYFGHQAQRDAAYHQGTVWAWLIGPFIEAYLKTSNFSNDARRKCRIWLSPLLRHLEEEACIGSISEIFEGDPPHEPRGAFAQAWSVAEVIRAWQMIHKTE